MAQDFKPDLTVTVTLWEGVGSTGKLPVGLGLNKETRQLLFAFGKLISNQRRPWWKVANREIHLLDFFFEHEIFFDGQLGMTYKHFDEGWDHFIYKIHLTYDSYAEFLQLLQERLDGKKLGRVSPKREYALVEILSLIISQMGRDRMLSEDEFTDRWYHLLDILENGVLEE